MSRALLARVRFLRPEEGGRSHAARAGVRPQLQVGDVFTSCVVHPRGVVEVFDLGTQYEVTLEVLYWDQYRDLFHDGMSVNLFEGSRLVARGVFLESLTMGP